ncbi:hypothetical protein R5R35_001458 [Gryllus longicercus]|uniref:Uncharacterized protein n=1 Tax=Gryllus longicercus TaxID=2509291 RepID=A0AAN9Z0D9_9ORTH
MPPATPRRSSVAAVQQHQRLRSRSCRCSSVSGCAAGGGLEGHRQMVQQSPQSVAAPAHAQQLRQSSPQLQHSQSPQSPQSPQSLIASGTIHENYTTHERNGRFRRIQAENYSRVKCPI